MASHMPTLRILMVCTGNICRSPMAAFLLPAALPALIREQVRVESAGTFALHGNPAEPLAVAAMARRRIDLSSHRARRLNREMVRQADLVLAMEIGHLEAARNLILWNRSKIRLLTDFDPLGQDPEIADPYGGPLADYLSCLAALEPCIQGVAAWATQKIQPAGTR
jgi:protein-tyrosine phosphatase